MYPAALTIARNSSRFPSRGFGACSLTLPATLSHNAPAAAIIKPATVLRVMRSSRNRPEVRATSSGSMVVIIDAWDAVVRCRAAASKRK